MRIWHESLVPLICNKHLCAMWNEAQTAYKIITCEKITVDGKQYRRECPRCGLTNSGSKKCECCDKRLDGYFYHPAIREFWDAPFSLYCIIKSVRQEMCRRRFSPKFFPIDFNMNNRGGRKPWQSIKQQKQILREKGCGCLVKTLKNNAGGIAK